MLRWDHRRPHLSREGFTAPPIRELRPLRAYTHQLNLVLVTNRGPTLEAGFYLSVSYSSYLPGAPGSADGGFEFPDITVSPAGVMTVPDGPLRYRKRLHPADTTAPAGR